MTQPHMVGGIWPYGDPEPIGAKPVGPWEFIARCIVVGSDVLREAGMWSEVHNHLTSETHAALETEVEKGSKEDVALSLWAMAQSARPFLEMASKREHRSEDAAKAYAEAVAGNFANLGMMWQMIASLAPKGIAEMAVSGVAAQAQRRAAAALSAEASRNKEWRTDAERLWAENPDWAVNKVATAIVRTRSTAAHLIDKSSVIRSISPLIPATSPSYKGQ